MLQDQCFHSYNEKCEVEAERREEVLLDGRLRVTLLGLRTSITLLGGSVESGEIGSVSDEGGGGEGGGGSIAEVG